MTCLNDRSRGLSLILAGLATLLGGAEAQASFLYGQTLSLTVEDTNYPQYTKTISFVVNDTVEVSAVNFPNIVNFNMEVDDSTITITYTSGATFDAAAFNGYIIKPVSAGVPAFGSITVDPATTLAGFTASRATSDSADFNANVSALSCGVGTVLKLDVKPAATAVPEPSSLALTGLGVLAIVALNRRRRAS